MNKIYCECQEYLNFSISLKTENQGCLYNATILSSSKFFLTAGNLYKTQTKYGCIRSKVFVYLVTNETTSENLVGFVVAFVKDYLGIQVGLRAVLFQFYIKTLIFLFFVLRKKNWFWS